MPLKGGALTHGASPQGCTPGRLVAGTLAPLVRALPAQRELRGGGDPATHTPRGSAGRERRCHCRQSDTPALGQVTADRGGLSL